MESPYAAPQATGSTVVSTEIIKNIKRISPLRAGIVAAATSALFVLIALLIMVPLGLGGIFSATGSTSTLSGPSTARMGMSFIVMLFVAPLIYGIVGFIGGIIWAWIYNLVAKMTGGIQITLEDPKYSSL